MAKSKNKLAREPSKNIRPLPRFFIYCEDTYASPDFFNHLKALIPNNLQVDPVGGSGVPKSIAKACIKKKKAAAADGYEDEIWAVFDRDEHNCYDEAISLCKANKIPVAHAYPCFEIWMMLAKGPHDGPCDRHQAQEQAKKCFMGYDPAKNKRFDMAALSKDEIIKMIELAEGRLVNRENEGSPYGNPSDTVFCLAAIILALGETPRLEDTSRIDRWRNIALRRPGALTPPAPAPGTPAG